MISGAGNRRKTFYEEHKIRSHVTREGHILYPAVSLSSVPS